MQIKCLVEERVSKQGKTYYCLYIPDLERVEMLSKMELKLLQMIYKDSIPRK